MSGARAIGVPLTAEDAHDVAPMCAVDRDAGVIDICNPNNPTGTITGREQIVLALAAKSRDALLLVDEAYIHLSDAETVTPLVASTMGIAAAHASVAEGGLISLPRRCGR